ncbi:LysM peptidoglycan-binding domain-containing protein [Priestia aryabhattai]|uniref:C40 family peptidase n=1 Tax=Priestia TaxID=2800373 RepID=UPI00398F1D9D
MKKRQLALSLGAIIGGTFLYQASAEASASTVQVKAGDTLWSLSTKYHTTVEALKNVNKLSSNTIHIGQTLSIPSASTSQPSNKEEKPSAPATGSTYKVQSGDTLWKVATRFNMSVEELKRLNALSSNIIYINQTLKVNGSNSASTPTTGKPAETTSKDPNGTYKVQRGDSLSKIASAFHMSVSELKQINGLTSNTIYVNQQLKVSKSSQTTTPTTKPSTSTPATSSGTLNVSQMISDAKRYMGVPYKWGGTTPSGFDCSGFIYYVMKQQISTTRYTTAGYWSVSTPVSNPQPGDLVFFNTYSSGPTHMGIYLGNRQFIHAGSSTGVTIASLDNSYWSKRYLGAKRFAK